MNSDGSKIDGLKLAQDKMREKGVDPVAIKVFSRQYQSLLAGDSNMILETDIEPVEQIASLDDLTIDDGIAKDAISKTAIIKLNGGLGTSMGLEKAKSLLEVRDGLTFLDIIVRQILHARKSFGAKLPLIFMNSFNTRDDTLEFIEKYSEIKVGELPLDFLQNLVPKLLASDLTPVDWPKSPKLEWSPPGHGDIYTALWGSGLLKQLIEAGYEYLHISNSDNLGAIPDAKLAGWFAKSEAPFAIEACRRTSNDKKGGHLAIRKSDGQMILREVAQTDEVDIESFMDISRHRYFNSNNIWLNLPKLHDILSKTDGVLDLPFIRNLKTVDPKDSTTPEVIQLESAMGSAIEKLDGATAIEIPRSRFLPVKKTTDLLVIMSDVFKLEDDYSFTLQAKQVPSVKLDDRYYKLISDFNQRFAVIPSLVEVNSLEINGDWLFNQPNKLIGDINLEDKGNQLAYKE